jgi:hypothetical protein
MRIDSCRKCGQTLQVLSQCNFCNQALQIECNSCNAFVDNPIHQHHHSHHNIISFEYGLA